MAILPQIQARYSVRSYQDRPVEEAKLRAVLEAARLAPSARNQQACRFVVVQDPALRQRLMAAANHQGFVGEAPVVIAACTIKPEDRMRCGQLSGTIDAAIALDHMTLQAVAEGLGTCWIGSFYEDQVRDILGIPSTVTVVELLTLGYAADSAPAEKRRIKLDDILVRDRWS